MADIDTIDSLAQKLVAIEEQMNQAKSLGIEGAEARDRISREKLSILLAINRALRSKPSDVLRLALEFPEADAIMSAVIERMRQDFDVDDRIR